MALEGIRGFLMGMAVPEVASESAESPVNQDTGVILVDLQGDFTTWKKGALAVSGADENYVNQVRATVAQLVRAGYPVYATQDWHPPEHVSFFTNHAGRTALEVISLDGHEQVLWPPHCVQGTANAEVLIDRDWCRAVVPKGMDLSYDSYSGFRDDGGQATELGALLARDGIQKVVVFGLASDYCVKATALDARHAGLAVVVVRNLCRGVAADTTDQAFQEMADEGVIIWAGLDVDAEGGLVEL